VELAVRIERAFGFTLPEPTLGSAVTLRDLLEAARDLPETPASATQAVTPTARAEPDAGVR